MVPELRLHRELLLRVAGDRDPAVPEHSERDPEREAPILGLQPGSAELGRRRPVMAVGFRRQVPESRGAEAQENDC